MLLPKRFHTTKTHCGPSQAVLMTCIAEPNQRMLPFRGASSSSASFLMVEDSPDPLQAYSPVPPDSTIHQILVERIDRRRHGVGMAVGVIEPQGRRVIAHGKLGRDDPRSVSGDSVFEIGSVTKVFTALLLADMAQRAELALTDPVGKFLPPEVSVPGRGRSITLRDLATHTSGLPGTPDNLRPANATNPFADYSVEQLYEFLSGHELRRGVGEAFGYSNIGYALLGHALARHSGVGYEALVRSRILAPLGMNSTAIDLSPDLQSRLAGGHDSRLQQVPNFELPTFAGAGALRSTARDLLTFLGAVLGYTDSALAPAMAEMLTVRMPTGKPGLDIALGWVVRIRGRDEIVWHGGGTPGYSTFLGYLRKARVGVVVLSNTSTAAVDDIGSHLLDAGLPLAPGPIIVHWNGGEVSAPWK